MTSTLSCPLCGGATAALELPHSSQSMLSDGRIMMRPLAKVSCLACGATSHRERLSEQAVQAFYGDDYALAAVAPAADSIRAANYAKWIADRVPAPRHIFEVGCGSGAMLRNLAARWPDASCLGIDPAAPDNSDPRVTLRRGFLELLATESETFDLILAVNVIEHCHDPARFLATLAPRLSDGGSMIIICPIATPANVELLFYDHLWTLTYPALAAVGKPAGLFIANHDYTPAEIGDFQMVRFQKGHSAAQHSPEVEPSALIRARNDYLRTWRDLDKSLAARAPDTSEIFGAGQAAGFLRAYAPQAWRQANSLVLDDVSEAWSLGKPVKPYDKRGASGQTVLIATAPRAQGGVAERLARDGFAPVRWDDLISQ